MKEFATMEWNEQKEIANIFANWLKLYTHEVIVKVLEKRNEIINNDFAMNLMRELYDRETKERDEFTDSIRSLLNNFETFSEFDPHNHALTHSKSYRDVLYDMYIR